MALSSIRSRVKKAQIKASSGETLDIVAGLIARGAFYDELTDEEKNAYCCYIGTDRKALEEIEELIRGNLHFQVERKEKPLTEAQFRQRVQEVEDIVNGYIEEYNTPEAIAEREKEYQQRNLNGIKPEGSNK